MDVLTSPPPPDKCGDDFELETLYLTKSGWDVQQVLGAALVALNEAACRCDCVGVYSVQHSIGFAPDGRVHVTVMGTGARVLVDPASAGPA